VRLYCFGCCDLTRLFLHRRSVRKSPGLRERTVLPKWTDSSVGPPLKPPPQTDSYVSSLNSKCPWLDFGLVWAWVLWFPFPFDCFPTSSNSKIHFQLLSGSSSYSMSRLAAVVLRPSPSESSAYHLSSAAAKGPHDCRCPRHPHQAWMARFRASQSAASECLALCLLPPVAVSCELPGRQVILAPPAEFKVNLWYHWTLHFSHFTEAWTSKAYQTQHVST